MRLVHCTTHWKAPLQSISTKHNMIKVKAEKKKRVPEEEESGNSK